ncbi:MAG: peptide-methionine (S)-S-oxide reductase MsrA [Patescibacteria group bacterium]
MSTEIAVFGGGCFWCTEAVFQMLRGVSSVSPGYAGGTVKNPTYEQVSNGNTGHAEVIHIEYDPAVVKYFDLLTVFFGSHDPTTLNRQGNDVGTQYRSVIFYTTPGQKIDAEKCIADINASNSEGKPIVTEITPLDAFYKAESYHEDYYARNKEAPYCQVIINPKLEKVQKEFADLLKANEQ